MENSIETCTGGMPTMAMKTEKEYFDECFAITIQEELVWRARSANHFGGDLGKRDLFNAINAGRAVAKINPFRYLDGTVELDGRNVPVKHIVATILDL